MEIIGCKIDSRAIVPCFEWYKYQTKSFGDRKLLRLVLEIVMCTRCEQACLQSINI